MHGAPVHVGSPAALGICALERPDFGEAVSLRPGEVPCSWAWLGLGLDPDPNPIPDRNPNPNPNPSPSQVPCFWACGVTPQLALQAAALPLAITHAPGHMLVGDLRNEELADRDPRRTQRHRPAHLMLLALLAATAAMAVGVAREEWHAGGGGGGGLGGGGAPADVGVAGQSVGSRVLWRLVDPTWLRFPMVGVVA